MNRLLATLLATFAVGLLGFAGASTAAVFSVVTTPSNSFSPANLVIQVGDTVRFTNNGGLHNVAATSGATFRCADGCDGDGSGGDGTPSADAWSFTIVFNTPGTINYLCEIHAPGMAGTITVQGSQATPGELRFTSSSFEVSEAGTSRRIEVERVGGRDGTATVQFATSDGSAVAGEDYTSAAGQLSWADQDAANKGFDVAIFDDSIEEATETVNLALSGATGAALGSPSSATLRINDNDQPVAEPSILTFSSSSYEGAEGGGDATITVQRTGGKAGRVGLDYSTSDGSAIAGNDYTATSGTLQWDSGEVAPKTFGVAILDDFEIETDETVNLALSLPTGGAVLGPDSSATLVIRDNDQAFPPCVADSTTLCLGSDGRFQVRVTFNPPNGEPGQAAVVDIGRQDSGLFYFFDENNIEMLIKVLNGCSITNNYWVFFAATTDVEFTLTVVDTEQDQQKIYVNPQGQPADVVTDTGAFATCP